MRKAPCHSRTGEIETGIGTEKGTAVMTVQNEVTEDRADLEGAVGGGEAEEAIGLVGAGTRLGSVVEDHARCIESES